MRRHSSTGPWAASNTARTSSNVAVPGAMAWFGSPSSKKFARSEVARQHGQLGGGVVLHLVDHHVLGVRVAKARERHLQVEPLDRREAVRAEQAHADAVDAQPVVVLHGGERLCVPVAHEAQREGALLLLVGRRDGLVEDAQLLVQVEGGTARPASRRCRPCCARRRLQAGVQLLAHERDAVGARGDAAQLVGELADRSRPRSGAHRPRGSSRKSKPSNSKPATAASMRSRAASGTSASPTPRSGGSRPRANSSQVRLSGLRSPRSGSTLAM